MGQEVGFCLPVGSRDHVSWFVDSTLELASVTSWCVVWVDGIDFWIVTSLAVQKGVEKVGGCNFLRLIDVVVSLVKYDRLRIKQRSTVFYHQ